MEHRDSYGTNFRKILYVGFSLKFVHKLNVFLRSDKNNRHFTLIPVTYRMYSVVTGLCICDSVCEERAEVMNVTVMRHVL